MDEAQQYFFWTVWDFRVQLMKRTRFTKEDWELINKLVEKGEKIKQELGLT